MAHLFKHLLLEILRHTHQLAGHTNWQRMGHQSDQIKPRARFNSVKTFVNKPAAKLIEGLQINASKSRHHVLASRAMGLTIHIGNINFLGPENSIVAKTANQFIDVILPATARIAHQ